MPALTVAMIAHDEEKNLARSLASAAWADELVFVDCASTDDTELEARKFPVKYFARPNSRAVYVNKQFAVDQASSDWVLILDADEELTPQLKAEIQAFIAAPGDAAAACMPRRNFYFGEWLRHGGKYPDTQLRLFKRGSAHFLPLPVHERLEVAGKVVKLREPLLHYPYTDLEDMRRKLDFYSEILTRSYALKGRSRLFIIFRPFSRFFSSYVLKLGFLDGLVGLRVALMDFRTVLASALRYIKEGGKD
jgi:glycosyltransferase involved in cell wall biosynthesis